MLDSVTIHIKFESYTWNCLSVTSRTDKIFQINDKERVTKHCLNIQNLNFIKQRNNWNEIFEKKKKTEKNKFESTWTSWESASAKDIGIQFGIEHIFQNPWLVCCPPPVKTIWSKNIHQYINSYILIIRLFVTKTVPVTHTVAK